MNRIYARCPQCDGKECTDISCKFSGIKHKNAAPQAVGADTADRSASDETHRPEGSPEQAHSGEPAVAAYDAIGYEAAWTGVPSYLASGEQGPSNI